MSTIEELFTLRLPYYWTPAEALTVYEFLNDLADAIWKRYEIAFIEQVRCERHYGDTSQPDLFDFDDPLPFCANRGGLHPPLPPNCAHRPALFGNQLVPAEMRTGSSPLCSTSQRYPTRVVSAGTRAESAGE